MITDMTIGNPTKTILKFALPFFIGNLFQQLYNIVDSVVVGKFLGTQALACVGSSFMLMNFFSFVIIGLCMGASTVYSIFYGEKDFAKLRNSIFISFSLIGIFTLLLTVSTMLNTVNLLRLTNTPADILQGSTEYLEIIFGGLLFVFLFNACSGLLRSIGDSRTPLYFLILAAIINVILDIVFVVYFHMGVKGVAWATIIAQAVSSVLCLIYAFIKVPMIRMTREDMRYNKSITKMVCKYSLLTSVQQSIMTFGMLCVQGIVNTFGAVTIAAFTAASKIDSIAYLPVQDFGNAFSTYIAQNFGAKNSSRIREGIKSAIRTILVFCLVFSTLIFFNAKRLMGIFIDPNDTEVIRLGVGYLSIISVFYVLIGFLFMFYGYFRGIGKLNTSLILTIISLGTRVIMAYVLSRTLKLGPLGICWAIPLGWVLADITGFLLYKRKPIYK
jgi:putative MATE family efflux protein